MIEISYHGGGGKGQSVENVVKARIVFGMMDTTLRELGLR